MSQIALLPLVLAGCEDSTGPSVQDFEWSGTIAQGAAIEIKGVNGSITAALASGNTVTVTAVEEGQQDDPSRVDIVVVTHSGGVTVCAIYPDTPGQNQNECAPGDEGTVGSQDNDVNVTFIVTVPAGVDFIGKVLNGSVIAAGLESNAFACTLNGDVALFTTRLAEGSTINGSVTASIGLTDFGRDLAFGSINGNVVLEVPAATNAEVRLSTVNGNASSDFPLMQVAPGILRGTIGTGGWSLHLETTNGSVALDRGP
jgi:DUF4097 and DUF4098 domain-containing protein YvlB